MSVTVEQAHQWARQRQEHLLTQQTEISAGKTGRKEQAQLEVIDTQLVALKDLLDAPTLPTMTALAERYWRTSNRHLQGALATYKAQRSEETWGRVEIYQGVSFLLLDFLEYVEDGQPQ